MSEEYATTRQDFLTATASYLGLNPDNVGADSNILFSEAQGDLMTAVIYVYLKPSDIIGIGKRMQEIAKEQGDIVEIHTEEPNVPDNATLRAEYDGLTQADKGRFGSFGQYMNWRMMNDKPVTEVTSAMQDLLQRATDRAEAIRQMDAVGGRQVTHVDAPEEPESPNMGAVWLWEDEATAAQQMHASDERYHNRDGDYAVQYLVQWSMLTDEQKQKIARESKA